MNGVPFIPWLAGWAGTVVGACIAAPQVRQLFLTKDAGGVSLKSARLYLINCICWLIYGIGYKLPAPIVANGIGLVFAIVQVALIVIYNRKDITQPPKRRQGEHQ